MWISSSPCNIYDSHTRQRKFNWMDSNRNSENTLSEEIYFIKHFEGLLLLDIGWFVLFFQELPDLICVWSSRRSFQFLQRSNTLPFWIWRKKPRSGWCASNATTLAFHFVLCCCWINAGSIPRLTIYIILKSEINILAISSLKQR